MANPFDDQFSQQTDSYARYRPLYPEIIYQHLAKLASAREKAWDCATGNGQAACALARYFSEVVATDGSADQISNHIACPNVIYGIATAEQSGLPDKIFDLVTVANAAHWFDRQAFYVEAKRVLKQDGVLALWRYKQPFQTGESDIDDAIHELGEVILKDYWSQKVQAVRNGYNDQPFPFHALDAPECSMQVTWDLDGLCGYFNSWSPTQAYIQKHQRNPVDLVYQDLANAWGKKIEKKILTAPLQFTIGRA